MRHVHHVCTRVFHPSTCVPEGPNSNHIKPSCATNMLFSSVHTCPPWVRANVIPATQWHKINSKVAATIVNMAQWAMERKIMFLQHQDWNQGRGVGKHNLSNSAVVLGRGGEVGGLLTEAQWSAAQRGARFPAIPSALGWALNAPLTPRWRRGHAASSGANYPGGAVTEGSSPPPSITFHALLCCPMLLWPASHLPPPPQIFF